MAAFLVTGGVQTCSASRSPLTVSRREESIPSFAGEGVRLSHAATMGQPHSPPNRPRAEGGRSSLLSWDLLCGCRKAGGRPNRTGEQREVKVSRETEEVSGGWRSVAARGLYVDKSRGVSVSPSALELFPREGAWSAR